MKSNLFIISSATYCICLSGCMTMDNPISTRSEASKELQRFHENPNLMIEKIESNRKSETNADIQSQNQKEEAIRIKKINDLLEKQLQNQRSPNP